MTDHDNLPVWAKILLGIPVGQKIEPNYTEHPDEANCSVRDARPSEITATEQRVKSVGCSKPERSRRWQILRRPVVVEFNS